MNDRKLTLNSARCKLCNHVIVSKHVHDWVSCKGGHIFIDGGLEYFRSGTLKPGVTFDAIEDRCEYGPENGRVN
jgi:hypothetical protein